MIVFHDLNGNFVNGWSYRSGKVSGKILPASDGASANIPCFVLPASYSVSPPLITRNGWEDVIYGGSLDEVYVTADGPEDPASLFPPLDNPWFDTGLATSGSGGTGEAPGDNPGGYVQPGGGGGSGSGIGFGGGAGSGDQIRLERIEVVLTGSNPAVVGEEYTLRLRKIPSNATAVISGVDYVLCEKGQEYVLSEAHGGSDFSLVYRVRKPGEYTFKAEACVNGTLYVSAPTAPVTHRFPNAAEVQSQFQNRMDALWTESKGKATQYVTYECAAIMWVDTREHASEIWSFDTYTSSPSSYSQTLFPAPFPEISDIVHSDPRSGGRWVVGVFHTHPGWDKAPRDRNVGKSFGDEDPDKGIPAWVMDYCPDKWIDNIGYITPHGAKTAGGKLEQYGGSGRSEN